MIRQRLSYIAFALLLAACASVQNVSESIGAGYASLTTVAHDVAQAKVAGLISDHDAADMKAQLQAAKSNLDLATSAYAAGDTANANDRIAQTHLVLSVLIQALKDREAK